MYDVISVIGAKCGMMVQDTILCNCSTRCNVSAKLSRDIDNGPVSNDISPPSSGFAEIEAHLIHVNVFMDNVHPSPKFSVNTKEYVGQYIHNPID